MRFVLFYHSVISDWNHGNAHFLRGMVRELQDMGHKVTVYEPFDGWSVSNLIEDKGLAPIQEFHETFPHIQAKRYRQSSLNLSAVLEGADAVIVHEWNDPALVRKLGEHRKRSSSWKLYFHDTHHRAVSAPEEIERYDLSNYDGVIVFGEILRRIYLKRGWADNVLTLHEAADPHIFRPLPSPRKRDLVWVGNWGDEERTQEIHDYFIDPVAQLGLQADVHGVRYPTEARRQLRSAGITYKGWVANWQVPRVFARHKFTVHIPRRPYVAQLAGIPTIRVFEALACGIPLLSAYWDDAENLFIPGRDYLVAHTPLQMRSYMQALANDQELRSELAEQGLRSILARHTCRHRVEQMLAWMGATASARQLQRKAVAV